MLITFHCLSIFIFQLLRNRKRIKPTQELSNYNTELEQDLEFQLKFDPPVYRQRYAKVYDTLVDERWRKRVKALVDFGCAEFNLFVFIKQLNLREIFFVDIDENLLKDNTQRLQPLLIDQIRRKSEPLYISIFVGSVSDPDYRLENIDVVTAVELIEHLYPDTLDGFPYNVFSFIEPKIAIITTPNVDFNVMFNKVDKFRHPDHKFEWSRQQFQDWALNIITRFPDYSVEFSGIGKGPPGSENLGCCSQMAVFIKNDVLEENFLSPVYAKPCLCLDESPCKGLTVESKLLCKCTCPLCQPSISVGVCTYYSYSYEIKDNPDLKPSYNIYYKLLEKINYPYEIDDRTEEEKLLHTFRYRINLYGHSNSRFYVEERNRFEIPVQDLMYGEMEIPLTESELCKLLRKFGYQIEECVLQETQQCENCIVYHPEMEETSSTITSSEASGYDSDCAKYQPPNEHSLSDWDEAYPKNETTSTVDSYEGNKKEATSLQTQSEPPTDPEEYKTQQDSLFDSGYQKSLSLLDDSPQTPLEDLEETDAFEEVRSTPSLSSDDNKLHLKKAPNKEKVASLPISLLPDFNKFKLEVNKINELDKFNNLPSARHFIDHVLIPQQEAKKYVASKQKEAAPGPSNVRHGVKKSKKALDSDDSPLDDVKSIANCIIENTLNKIEVPEDKIKDEVVELIDLVEEPQLIQELPQEPMIIVENGDLANNNRDVEGNNYIADPENDGNDLINYNHEEVVMEEMEPLVEDNAIFDNNNRNEENEGVIEEIPQIIEGVALQENQENVPMCEEDIERQEVEGISNTSREALFDPNSEQDLLEDFEVPDAIHDNMADILNLGNNVILIGLHSLGSSTPENLESAIIPTNNAFPDWLLQILGAHIITEEIPDTHDEPHFYCQGDGLGVHPSVIAVEVDEEEDGDDETTDNTNNTADFAEVEQGPSDQDVTSFPESLANNTENTLDDTSEARHANSDTEQFFDTTASSENLNASAPNRDPEE